MANNKQSIYLEKLEFDEKLNNSWMSFFIDRTRFTWLVIIMIFIAWFLWLKSLPLESTPEVNIWVAVISTTLVWASPESIEDLVTKKIEKQIAKVKWIDSITSTSLNSVSLITVQFKSDTNTSDAIKDLKDKVDLAKADMPSDTKDSVVKEISFDDTPIWTFAISWKYDWFTLYEYAKTIKEELEKISLVSEVNISWWKMSEYWVFLDPKKLEQYSLSLDTVNNAIKWANFTIPIWEIEVWEYKHSISVDNRFYDIEKLKNVVVTKLWETWVIYLKDVAEVKEVAKKVTSISRLSGGWKEPLEAVTLWVVKKKWWSIVNLVTLWEQTIKDLREKNIIPKDVEIKTIVDQSERIKLDLSHLIRDWIITVLLVFITLFLVIWIKEALVAWAAVPLVFLITFCVMAIAWQTLNFLSMFALILSLWLLVDDAIVVISAINQYKKSWKFTTREAALLVIRDYKRVLTTTTLTVVWIFSAMLFMTWIMWKFIFSIPFVITITLLASLVVALTLNPALAVILSWRNSKTNPEHFEKSQEKLSIKTIIKRALENWFISIHTLEQKYWNALEYLLFSKKRVKIFLFSTLLLFISALILPISWILKSDFFPKWDQDNLYINIETEAWTKLNVTSSIAIEIEKILLKEKEIDSFSTSIWWLSAAWWSSWWSNNSENYANISINLIKEEYWRLESSMSIAERLRWEFSKIKNARVTVIEIAWWPPAWSDFELKIAWDDFAILDKIANDVKTTLSKIPWTINIQTSRKPLPFEFNLVLDPAKLSLYDITVAQVSLFLRNVIDWTESSKIYKWTDEVIIKTRFNTESVDSFDKIKDLKMLNNRWIYISLRDLVKQDFKPSVFSITRIDQERIVTVSAGASKKTTWAEIKKAFDKEMWLYKKWPKDKIIDIKYKLSNMLFWTKIPPTIKEYKLPSGYKFMTGWANEENAKSVQSLLIAMIFGMMFIVATLVLLYDSYRQAVLVMVTIPLSLIWVFYGLTLFGQPLSFPGLIWLVALFGIVVRNWIILFDKINQNIEEKIEFKEAILDAWRSRLEPVFLTSVCTVLGMIPLTLSNPTWTSLGLSIIFWLSVSTVFTLLVLPSLYYVVFRKKYLGR